MVGYAHNPTAEKRHPSVPNSSAAVAQQSGRVLDSGTHNHQEMIKLDQSKQAHTKGRTGARSAKANPHPPLPRSVLAGRGRGACKPHHFLRSRFFLRSSNVMWLL